MGKSRGYACLTGAWFVGALFVALVAHNMLLAAGGEQGTAAMHMFAVNLSVISFFCQPASVISIVVVIALAAAKFDKRHIVAECLLAAALGLVAIAIQWYMQSINLAFMR